MFTQARKAGSRLSQSIGTSPPTGTPMVFRKLLFCWQPKFRPHYNSATWTRQITSISSHSAPEPFIFEPGVISNLCEICGPNIPKCLQLSLGLRLTPRRILDSPERDCLESVSNRSKLHQILLQYRQRLEGVQHILRVPICKRPHQQRASSRFLFYILRVS